jgi:M6 family metalloprotease-like protein
MKLLRFLMTMTLVSVYFVTSRAVSAYPGALHYSQPDGTVVTFFQRGDEHFHAFYSSDGYMLQFSGKSLCYVNQESDGSLTVTSVAAHDENQRTQAEMTALRNVAKPDFSKVYHSSAQLKAPRRISGSTAFPTKGNLRGLILLVNFADMSMTDEHTSALFHSEMNDSAYSQYGGTGSSRDYFISQSGGQFVPTFDVFGPIPLSHGYAYYGSNSGGQDIRPGEMVVEACQYAHDSLGVDFTKYDFNSDGEVDFVYVIYAGYAESYGASANTIWPHAASLSNLGLSLTLDGKSVGRYACSSELKYTSGTTLEGIGTFCHEFGHVLGLPDMYNTLSTSVVELGQWDIMDQGNYNNESHTPPSYSSFERYSLGWLEYTDIDTPAYGMSLTELTTTNKAYRIRTSKDNEYFTLENRQQKGWDAYQPGKGLMVFHIDYDQSFWDNNTVNASTHPHCDLVEADNSQSTNSQNDLYPGPTKNTMLTDYSTPNMLLWDNTPVEKGLTDIRDSDGIIMFDFMHDKLHRPVLADATAVDDTSFIANWNAVDEATAYKLDVNELLPDSLKQIILEEDFSKMKDGAYPVSNNTNISETMDSYTSTSNWYGTDLYECGGYVRLGSYGVSGELDSPYFTADKLGSLTVAVQLRSYPGKSVNYTIAVKDIDSGTNYESHRMKATKAEQNVILHIDGAAARNRLVISTEKERLFVDAIRILKGNIDSAKVWTVGPAEFVYDSIRTTSCKVTGLIAGRTYKYTVQALANDSLKSSLLSDVGYITMTNSSSAVYSVDMPSSSMKVQVSGRTMTLSSASVSSTVVVTDIAGRRIATVSPFTGTRQLLLPSQGVYILRSGSLSRKLLVE